LGCFSWASVLAFSVLSMGILRPVKRAEREVQCGVLMTVGSGGSGVSRGVLWDAVRPGLSGVGR
jgi:hypothetical protein